jgi:hypothetical protein
MKQTKIDSVTKVAKPKKIKEPILQKKVLMSNNKLKATLGTIKPQEEAFEAIETVSTEIPTPLIPEIVQEPILDVSTAESTSVGSADFETKLAKERKFAKIALCLGIVVLVIMIINKK